MKHLLPLILLCALLCGCGRTFTPEEVTPVLPTESVAGTVTEPEEFGGAVRTVPLNLRKVRGLRVFQGNLLLFSGQGSTTLTLLRGDSLEEIATMALDFSLDQEDPSLRLHPDGTLSFYDSATGETLVLDRTLQVVRRIPAPGALSGSPILSDDGNTLFYCTASHLRAWDLESGIHRCVKEMALEGQILTGVLLESKVLQCQISENGRDRSIFLSAADGQLLRKTTDTVSLVTLGNCYYASVPAGTYRVSVFGQGSEPPTMLIPEDLTGQAFFLPEHNAAVTAACLPDNRVKLEYYSLSSGSRSFRLTLGFYQLPRAVECLDEDTLAILTYDPELDQEVLTFWDLQSGDLSSAQDRICYTEPYFPSQISDTAGLAQCRQQAQAIGKRCGIRILLGEEAVQSIPREYAPEAEHLVPILQRELSLLEHRLSCFPDSVLQETAAHFSCLNLCLVRSLRSGDHPEAPEGTQFLKDSEAYLVIPTGTNGEQALYHQLFHLMEIHIFAESKVFDQWDTLNPAGFRYDYDYTVNALRDSGVYLFQDGRAFVDTYSMSFPKEDRARILEFAMLPDQAHLFRPPAMQRKLKAVCTGIREAYRLDNPSGSLLWEQYLEK